MTTLTHMAYTLADRACICDIECNSVYAHLDGLRWLDIRAMTDPREMCDDVIEMHTQALAYAEARGLFTKHPEHAHLVRINTEHHP